MKAVLAIQYEELEEYIAGASGIEVLATARDKSHLLALCTRLRPDLVILAHSLPGFEEMEITVNKLLYILPKNTRIIYLYGEVDENKDAFIDFLIEKGIYDFHIGRHIHSDAIEKLLYHPRSRSEVLNGGTGKGQGGFSALARTFAKLTDKGTASKAEPVILKALEGAVITLYSAHATGKSHTAWNLAQCLGERGLQTAVINLDKGYSANLYYGVDASYYDMLDYMIETKKHKEILKHCYKRKNVHIITGKLGDTKSIAGEDFLELLYHIRSKCDVTLIDTESGLSPLTRLAVKNSTLDLLVFDSDLMHFHLNKLMIEGLGDDFIPEKTIALINHCDTASESYRFIRREILDLGFDFKALLPIESCGTLGCDMMNTGRTAYEAAGARYEGFANDMGNLLAAIHAGEKKSRLTKWLKV